MLRRSLFSILAVSFFLAACSGENFSMLTQAARFGDAQGVWKYAAEGMDINERTRDGKTPLILAAAGGHTKAVEALLELGADPGAQDNVGATALLIAATAGHADTVRVLLTRGADAGIKDRDGGTPLLNAVFFGYRNAVAELLKRKQTIPQEDMNEALLIAAGMGHTEIVEDMLTVGVDVNVAGKHQRTPLMAAVKFDRVETVRTLVNRGANPELKNEDGETALAMAKTRGNSEIIAALETPPAPAPELSTPPPQGATSPPLP